MVTNDVIGSVNRRERGRPARGRISLLVALLATLSTVGGCSSGSAPPAGPSSPAGTVIVFAAASLQEVFTKLGRQFEQENAGTTVTFSFAGSSELAAQINQGAPADVFAAASEADMLQVGAAAGPNPVLFARNSMVIAVPPGNPAGITGVNDLANPGVKVALCAPQVPCGAAAQQVFTNAGITVTPVTLEPDVKATLSKVELGEVDAGVVYITDLVAAGGKVRDVWIDPGLNVSTAYPIVALTKAPNPVTAQAFIDFVLSQPGQLSLQTAGFQAP